MANPIIDKLDEYGRLNEEFRKTNDERLKAVEQGNESRAKELEEKLSKMDKPLNEMQKAIKDIPAKLEAYQSRIEMLEALADRPRSTIQDQVRSEHKDNAMRWIRSGGTDNGAIAAQQDLERKAREVKDVSTGTTTAGGFALPEEISRTVNTMVLKLSEISRHVKNVTVGTTDYKELLTHFANGTASNLYAWAGETGARSATGTPELRERTPTWGELYAYATASNWSLRDLFFSVEQWITAAAAEGFSVGQSVSIWNGNGTSKPTGMTNTAPTSADDYASPLRAAAAYEYIPIPLAGSSPFTTAGITADSVIALNYQLNPRYRGNAKFAANTVTQGHIRRLKDTTGQYIWQPSFQIGQPERLLGYELFTFEEMGNPTTANALPLAFGDFNQAYTLASREGLDIVRDNVTAAGFTKFYISKRVAGCVTNNDALKFLKCSLS